MLSRTRRRAQLGPQNRGRGKKRVLCLRLSIVLFCSLSRPFAASQKKKKLPQPQLFLFLSLSSSSFQHKQATGMLYVDRILYSSVIYPANYGELCGEKREKRRSFSFLIPSLFSLSRPRPPSHDDGKKKLKKKLPKLPLLLLQASSPRRSAKTTTPWTSSC